MFYRTANPIADAERHAEDSTPVIGVCEECGHDIHVWQDAFRISARLILHEECLMKYARDYWNVEKDDGF